jgi:hypothetical protein
MVNLNPFPITVSNNLSYITYQSSLFVIVVITLLALIVLYMIFRYVAEDRARYTPSPQSFEGNLLEPTHELLRIYSKRYNFVSFFEYHLPDSIYVYPAAIGALLYFGFGVQYELVWLLIFLIAGVLVFPHFALIFDYKWRISRRPTRCWECNAKATGSFMLTHQFSIIVGVPTCSHHSAMIGYKELFREEQKVLEKKSKLGRLTILLISYYVEILLFNSYSFGWIFHVFTFVLICIFLGTSVKRFLNSIRILKQEMQLREPAETRLVSG